MAPGRKKGGGTVKAAAGKREWNVGELVLAKVKGYPAWPAQISKAEEKGWPPNPNKIFVSFFGTKQIRFCHYSEILPFTPRERSGLIGKLQQKQTADFARAIKEICKADDEQKDENQVDMNEGTLENEEQHEDGNLSHAEDKLGHTDVEGSDEKRDSDLGSPGTRSSDGRSVGGLLKDENESKHGSEGERDTTKITTTGNDVQRLDEGKPEADALPSLSTLEGKSSQVSVKGGDSFDADQVHYYRKKVRKPVKEEEKPQEVAPVVEKQPTPPITESPKGGGQPRRAAFGKALKRLNQSLEKKPSQPEVQIGILRGHFPKKKTHKQRRFKNREEAMPNGGAGGSSKAGVMSVADMDDDDMGLFSPLQRKGRRFGKGNSKIASRGGVVLQSQSVAAGSDDDEVHTTEVCVENRLLEEPLERTDSPALSSSPVSPSDSDDVLLASGKNQGRARAGVGQGSSNHIRKKGNFPIKSRADVSKVDDSDEAKESDDDESDYNDEDYEYGKAAAFMSNRRKKRMHKATKAYFKSSKKVKTAGGTSPREVNVALKSTESSVKESKISDIREKGTSLPPKAAKYRIRSSLPDDEAVLPPSKRWHPAFEALNSSEIEGVPTVVGEPGNVKNAVVPGVHASQDGSEHTVNAKGSETKFTPRKGTPALGKSCSLSRAAVFTADVLDSSHLTRLPSIEADGKETVKKVGDGKVPAKVHRGNSLPASKAGGSGHLTKGHNEKSHSKGSDLRKVSMDKQGKARDEPKGQSDKSQVKLKTYKPRRPITSPRKEPAGTHISPEPKRTDDTLPFDRNKQEGSGKQPLLSSLSITPGKAAPSTPKEKGKGLVSVPSGDGGRINGVKPEGFTTPVKLRQEVPDGKIRQAVEAAKETKQKSLQGDGSASSMSLKYLIAAAQAKRQAKQMPGGVDHSDKLGSGPVSSPSPLQGRGSSRLVSPVQHVPSLNPQDAPKPLGPYLDFMSPNGGNGEAPGSVRGRTNEKDKPPGAQPSGSRDGEYVAESTEAAVARDAFTGMLETLSRTKESIGRASHHALECVKHGIADQIVDTIVEKLENEPSFHRRVDLFFLVDSITQCSHTSKGTLGAAFPPIVKDALPRLLNAAAPPGSSARDNRKQCLKVLKLWLERGILPEQTLRHFISEIEAHNDGEKYSAGSSRRPSRSERAVDDPLREMEGMFVDEYGSNASFALPGLLIPRMFEDDEEGSDGIGENQSEKQEVVHLSPQEETSDTPAVPTEQEDVDKHCHVLEDVDGELEMEDVSPSEHDIKAREEETVDESPPHSTSSADGQAAAVSDVSESSMAGSPQPPPLPQGPPPPPPPSSSPPSPPPLPASPPPSPPPPPPSSPTTTAEEEPPVQPPANHSHVSQQAVQNFMPVGKPVLREIEQPRPGIFTPFTPQPIQVAHSVVGPSYGSSSAFPNTQVSTRPNGPNLASPMSYANLGPPISQGLAPALNSHGPPSAYAAAHAKHLAQSAAHAQHVAQTAAHLHGSHKPHHPHVGQVPALAPQTSPHMPQNTSHVPPLPLGNPSFVQRPYMQPLKPLPGGPHRQPQLIESSTQFGVDQEKVSPHLRRVIQEDQLRQRHDPATERTVESGLNLAEGRPMPVAGGSTLPTEGHVGGENTVGGAQFLSGNSSFHPPDQVYRMNNGMMRSSHVTPQYSSGHANLQHPIVPQQFAQPPFRHSAPMQGNMSGNVPMLVPPPPSFQYNASLPGAMQQGGAVPPPQGQHMMNFRPGGPTQAPWRPS